MAAGCDPAPHLTPETGAGERAGAAEVSRAPCRASSLSLFRSRDVTIQSRILCVISHAFLAAKCVNDTEGNSHSGFEGNNLQRTRIRVLFHHKKRRINSNLF